MDWEKVRAWLKQFYRRWIEPLYHAWISVLAGLFFGLLPVWMSWIHFLLKGELAAKWASTLSKGDVLMVACSLAGSAVVLGFRKRNPETLPLQEFFGFLGIVIVIVCALVSVEASPDPFVFDQIAGAVVLELTLVLLPVSVCYAMFMIWQSERSFALRDFRDEYDVNGNRLNIDFQQGGKR